VLDCQMNLTRQALRDVDSTETDVQKLILINTRYYNCECALTIQTDKMPHPFHVQHLANTVEHVVWNASEAAGDTSDTVDEIVGH